MLTFLALYVDLFSFLFCFFLFRSGFLMYSFSTSKSWWHMMVSFSLHPLKCMVYLSYLFEWCARLFSHGMLWGDWGPTILLICRFAHYSLSFFSLNCLAICLCLCVLNLYLCQLVSHSCLVVIRLDTVSHPDKVIVQYGSMLSFFVW